MRRRLLGYVVKLPDGRRLPETTSPTIVAEADRLGRRWAPAGSYVCPVFAVPKKPKPAPEASDKDGRYAVLVERQPSPNRLVITAFVAVSDYGGVGSWEAAKRTFDHDTDLEERVSIVRIMKDGEHEAAVEAARREALEEVRAAIVEERSKWVSSGDYLEFRSGMARALFVLDEAAKKGGTP